LKAERERAAMLQAEADAKAKAERDAETARVKAEKKAAAAPDKVKLIALISTLGALEMPNVSSDEAKEIVYQVHVMIEKMSRYIRENAEKL